MLDQIGQASAIGTPEHAAEQVPAFIARTGAEEVIFVGPTLDPAHRERALALTMAALADPASGA
jgi:alkanesulfonate monooxygenase SsuD/methylene tetrahydromethanopterin reductase-like flavin-dependent oxidoreductase (luciferase family)